MWVSYTPRGKEDTICTDWGVLCYSSCHRVWCWGRAWPVLRHRRRHESLCHLLYRKGSRQVYKASCIWQKFKKCSWAWMIYISAITRLDRWSVGLLSVIVHHVEDSESLFPTVTCFIVIKYSMSLFLKQWDFRLWPWRLKLFFYCQSLCW